MTLIPLRQKIIDHILSYEICDMTTGEEWALLHIQFGKGKWSDVHLTVLRLSIFLIEDHRGEIFPRHTIRARMHELRNDPETPKIVSSILKQMVMIGK